MLYGAVLRSVMPGGFVGMMPLDTLMLCRHENR